MRDPDQPDQPEVNNVVQCCWWFIVRRCLPAYTSGNLHSKSLKMFGVSSIYLLQHQHLNGFASPVTWQATFCKALVPLDVIYQLVLNILMALKACPSISLGIPVSRIPRFPPQRSLLRLMLSTWRLVVFLFASSCILGWSCWSLTQTTNRTICYNLISHNKNIQEQEQFNVAAWLWHVWSCEIGF